MKKNFIFRVTTGDGCSLNETAAVALALYMTDLHPAFQTRKFLLRGSTPWPDDLDQQSGSPGFPGDFAVGAVAIASAVIRSVTAVPATTALYLQEPGDAAAISINDIHQGQIGDCFVLSPIGELALLHPSAITAMIHANADGTETVTLYVASNGVLPGFGTTVFKAVAVTVTNSFPANVVNNGASQDVVNGVKEIWVQVLEQAVATLNGGYSAIASGGYPSVAMEELTGCSATSINPATLTLQLLQTYQATGDLITMDTSSSAAQPYGLVRNHAYFLESLTMVNGAPMVQLGNPWGFNNPVLIPLSQLARAIVQVDVGRFASAGVTAAPTISGTVANQTATDQTPITPFSNVSIADPNAGQIETVTVTPSTTANGALSNFGGGSYNAATGVYSDTGSASAVTADLNGLIFTPNLHQTIPGGSKWTGFTLAVSDSAGAAATDTTSSVLVTATAQVVAPGTVLTIGNAQSLPAMVNNGTVTIGNGASLDLTFALDPASSGVFQLQGRSSLEIAAALGGGAKIQFLGTNQAEKLTLDSAASFGLRVGTAAYTGPLLENFAAGDVIDIRGLWGSGLKLNYASDSGLLQIMRGGAGVASLLFQNSTLGSGGFHAVSDGSGGAVITHA